MCSTKVEYIAEAKETYFLTPGIPRIRTPVELWNFLENWDWEKIRRGPLVIAVGSPRVDENTHWFSFESAVELVAHSSREPRGRFGAEEWLMEGALLLPRDVEGALVCFEAALNLDSDNRGALVGKAIALGKRGDPVEAVLDCFDRAISLDPKNISAWNSKGSFLAERLCDHQSAIACYEKALELDPEILSNVVDGRGQAAFS